MPDISRTVRELTGVEVRSVAVVQGGGNSCLYRVDLVDGTRLAAKRYPPQPLGGLERMARERAALTFLRVEGVSCVPEPAGEDRRARVALFEWIDGAAPEGDEAALDAVVDFVRQLLRVARHSPGSRRLHLATEACLCGEELVNQLLDRERRLLAEGEGEALRRFLRERLVPARERFVGRARAAYGRAGSDMRRCLEVGHQTLSPSDFGLHNMLRREDGRHCFVDFEYFGWDDPVKLVADFLLHPGMRLSPAWRSLFFRRMLPIFGDDHPFECRFRALFPLYGLRWCLIMLNEFLGEGFARRSFARDGGRFDREEVRRRQLDKATTLLNELEEADGQFFG